MAGIGVDIAFFPAVETLYPLGYETYVNVEGALTQKGSAAHPGPDILKG